ncbi:MAG: uroporphyrinogen-III synthase [Candidatus Koribacter versatilis]|uniref:Uroporphyrinogen-III synthase n=1 Tax=Candidatus Korobacter versatilis TaxID=658062 RepID=A0A932ENN2_9BACT|nr:uroporphyrinogen-III synthase [Candidatus Koribacter versatilis]
MSRLLRAQGANVIEIPAIEIRTPRSYAKLDAALAALTRYDWLVLTSVNGVEAFFTRMRKRRVRTTALARLKVAAIGPATKRAIEHHGVRVAVMPREYVAEAVVQALRGRVHGKRTLLVRAKVARDVIPRELRRAGARVDVVEAYETVVPIGSASRIRAALGGERRPNVITFTSSSTVRNFVGMVGDLKLLRSAGLASIGPVTSATLRELGLKPTIEAKQYTMEGLVRAIASSKS